MIKNTISTLLKYRDNKNTITYAHKNNLSVHDSQTVSLITQNFWIVQIMALLEIDKRLLNAKIDFVISSLIFKILFVTNILLSLLCRQRPNILRYTLLYATQNFENDIKTKSWLALISL